MKENRCIYFDNAATTKPNREVVLLHNRLVEDVFANPNSIHHLGIEASKYLTKARESIFGSFKLKGYKVIFTSSSTEANNLAIKGYCLNYQNRGKHIITTNVEHPSVLECFEQLKNNFGFEVTILNVNNMGVIDISDLEKAMKKDTMLVSVMAVNNEIGSINNIDEISNVVHKYPKANLHVDTTQAVGKVKLNYSSIDMFVVSSHKIHGFKGSGALICKSNLSFLPLISGGGQEDGLRSGTSAVDMDVTLAKAISLEMNDFNKNYENIKVLQGYLLEKLAKIENIELNSNELCSPYIVNFSLLNKKAAVMVEALSQEGIYVSSVSACHSKKEAISYVVKALGKSDELAHNTIRISLDPSNTKEEIDTFIEVFEKLMRTLR